MSKKNFCCVGDFPVLIPYEELQNLLNIAQNYEKIQSEAETKLSRMEEKYSALQVMFTELCEKIGELRKMI